MRKQVLLTLALLAGTHLAGQWAAWAEPAPQTQSQNTVTITGTVFDENNEPVIGANVSLRGKKSHAVNTDIDGNFTIKVPQGSTLTVSFIGYKTESVLAKDGMAVYLQPTTEQLDQLVVVGYGTQKKANLTGAVATVDVARVMDSRPVQDVTKALQGVVPGLTITNGTGGIGSDATIRIRGVGTLTNGQASDPLIVVDGVPVDNLNFLDPDDIQDISVLKDASSSAIYGARAAFGVILITTKGADTADKVSINYSNNFAWSGATVLPKFANIVDELKSDLQAYYRLPTTGNAQSPVGGMNYAALLPYAEKWQQQHGGKRYTSIVELQPYVDENNVGDYYVDENGKWIRYADWDVAETLFTSAAPSQKHNISIEGTSGKTQYRLAFGYDKKQGLMQYNPDKMERYMANVNLTTQLTNWLKAGTRISYTQREYTEPNTPSNTYQYAWRWAPFISCWGTLPDPITGEQVGMRNTLSERLYAPTDKAVTRQTRLQAWAQAEIIKGLTLQADFTYDYRNYVQHASWGLMTMMDWGNDFQATYTWPTAGVSRTRARKDKNDMDRWTANVYATYDKTFAENHNLKVMAGFSAERYTYDNLTAIKYGLVDLSLPELNLTSGTEASDYSISSGSGHRATAGFFGRINYDYKNRYLIEFNGRYDGSTRFPAHKQWAFFPSASAGWRFSEENFFEPVKSWWSNGKLRASYGHLGNENLAANQFISTVALYSQNVNWLNAGGTKLSSAGTPTLVSNDLSWERVITTDVGLDLGFLDNSLTFGFDWYSRLTKDMLTPGGDLPSTLGASSPLVNGGSMRTNGWELSISYNKSFGDWDFWASATLGDARSKVTKWAYNDNNTLYSYVMGVGGYRFYEGQTFGDIWGFEWERYFEESDFVKENGSYGSGGKSNYAPGVANQDYLAFSPFTFGPGDNKFKDLNGDGVINNGDPDMVDENGNKIPVGTLANHGDLKVIGNALPRYEYGFRFGGAWKGIDLDIFLQGIGKRDMWQITNTVMPFAQANSGIFEHQLSHNSYIVDDAGAIIGYDINQNNDYPVLTSGDFGYNSRMRNTCNQGINNWTLNNRYLVNMAYLRVKNITVGYTIPYEFTKKAYIQKARIYFSTENPFFLYNGAGKYKIDPELASVTVGEGLAGFGRTDPIMRAYSFGIQVTF